MLAELDTLFDANTSQAKGIAAIYQFLTGGVPSIGGFTYLINSNNATNFGAGAGPVFNDENIYINVANALVQGNSTAKSIFDTLAVGATLQEQVTSIYKAIIPLDKQTPEGLEYITRPEGLAFYQQVALERGITTANGGAIIALASILKIAVDGDIGVGNSVSDLLKAVKDGTAVLPDTSDVVIPIETADGSAYDDASDAVGVTTVFSGSELNGIADGTLELSDNIYTDQTPASNVQSILVANGADLVAKGVIALGGAVSELTVFGAGSTLTVEAGVGDSENSNFGRFAGETSTVNIFSGGAITFEKKINLAELRVESDRGTLGGTVTADLNVLDGGMLVVKTEANFAANWKNDNSIGNGSEKAISNVVVDGTGSSVEIQQNTAHFGSSAGTASLTISGGGTVTANEVRFGFVTDLDLADGGEGNLSIMGQGSSLTLTGDFSEFGVGVGSVATIVIDDQGKFSGDEVSMFRAGGSGVLTVSNGGVLDLDRLEIGQLSGSTADVFVKTGGKISVKQNVNLAEFVSGQTFDNGGKLAGVTNGASVVNMEISGGGSLVAGSNISAAYRFDLSPDFAPGDETGQVNITVTGAGSLLESKTKTSDFGISKGGVAHVNILDGGKAIFGDGANFGAAFDEVVVKGGEGHLTISGAGSSVSFQDGKEGNMSFGEGENTLGSLVISAGGTLTAGSVDAGRNGGEGNLSIMGQGSSLTFSANFSQSGVGVGSVATIVIDDQGKLSAKEISMFRAGGSGVLTVSNGGMLDLDRLDLGQMSGSTADVFVKSGGKISVVENVNIAEFVNGQTFSSGDKLAGVIDGASVVNMEISGGGSLIAGSNISAASRFDLSPDFAPGNETGQVNITVTGDGSLLESKSNYSNFGVSKGGVAHVNILDGGNAVFGDGVNFGAAFDDVVVKGGEGHLTISGTGSSVSFQASGNDGEMNFGRGENTLGSLTVSAGGMLTSGGIRGGRDGGKAVINIDGGSVNIGQIYDDGNSAGLELGRDASAAGISTMSISNGGTLVIDGQGGRSPYINLGRNAGGEASLDVKGTGSSITLINDTPVDIANGVTDFGNAVISIGRDGTGSMSITEGAQVHNTQHGAVIVGNSAGAVGTLLVDGAGSVLDFGGIMWVGTGSGGGGMATFSVLHGASVNLTGIFQNDDWAPGIQLGSATTTMTVDSASTVKSDIYLKNGNFVVGPAVETVSIQGDFDQTGGKISIEIDGAASNDKLITSGLMKLDAKIDIDFINSFAGAVGNSFELFNASSFEIGSNFALDVSGLGAGLDAQLQVNGGVASLVIFDSAVPDVLVA